MHIAIIMDGNGRWAANRRLPRFFGHRAGAERVEEMIAACEDLMIGQLTLFAFSTENWQRPKKEVAFIFNLLAEKIRQKTPFLVEKGIRVRFFGDRALLPEGLCRLLDENERVTRRGKKLDLSFCLNYGAQDEIVRACRKVCREMQEGRLEPADLTPRVFSRYLDTGNLPPPDLIIRTSGEQRLSNFLLYQAAYAEFYFTPVLWPDFTRDDLARAVAELQRRQRRFGKSS